jgi:hypothetical protein
MNSVIPFSSRGPSVQCTNLKHIHLSRSAYVTRIVPIAKWEVVYFEVTALWYWCRYCSCINSSRLCSSSCPIPCVLSKYEWVGQSTAGSGNIKKCDTSKYLG